MILEEMEKQKFSIDNIAFGMGGKLLQGVSRDDFSFAYKVSSAIVNGELIDVFKSPKGDLSKTSKKGVVYVNADMEYTNLKPDLDMLQPVFMDGKVIIDNTFDEIRERVRTS
jgi:nicotinamide phosphoribosyltransferase